MINYITIETQRNGFHDVTTAVLDFVENSGIKNGVVTVEVPYSTAGLLKLSLDDTDITKDILREMKNLLPSRINFTTQKNPDEVSGYAKSAFFGNTISSIVQDGKILCLENNVGLFLAEYDGPNQRDVYMTIVNVD